MFLLESRAGRAVVTPGEGMGWVVRATSRGEPAVRQWVRGRAGCAWRCGVSRVSAADWYARGRRPIPAR